MPVCHLCDTALPPAEAPLGRAEFAELPRPRDLVSFWLPGRGRMLCEVVGIEHAGVHESTDRSATPAGAPGIALPLTEPATVLHVRILDADGGAGP